MDVQATTILYELLLLGPPLLLSLTIHEYAHARVALAFGDPTAKLQGRVSLNPLVHLDLLGTIVLLVTRFIGWAKPVPVNPANLHPPRLGNIMVSLAGPLSNLALAVAAGLTIRLMLTLAPSSPAAVIKSLYLMLFVTMSVNLMLCLFNLLPLFPLDGHHVVREMLAGESQIRFMNWQVRFGRYVLLGIILGPRIIGMLTRAPVFSPVAWAYHRVASLAIRVFGITDVIALLA